MKIVEVNVNELIPSIYNPRKADKKEWKNLENSIKEFGLVDPIIVNSAPNRKNIIIGGHFRCKVAESLGIEKVPVVYVNIADEKKEKELNLRLNRNLGEWDFDMLANFEEELLKEVGFDKYELDKLIDIQEDNFDAQKEYDKIKEPITKLGDLWKLGEHKLLCGNSENEEDFKKLMGEEKAQMVLADPPYGMNLNTDFSSMKGIGRGKKYKKIIGDEKNFNPSFIINLFNYCKEQIWWGADYYSDNIPNRLEGSWFVWDKTECGIRTNSAYNKQFGSNFELCWSRKKHKRQIIPVLWKGIFGLSKEDTKKRIHPTQKPVRLLEFFIKNFSKLNNIILEPFNGSGSTMIACEQLQRKCRAIELDPKFVQTALIRWKNYTNKEPIRINDGKKLKEILVN